MKLSIKMAAKLLAWSLVAVLIWYTGLALTVNSSTRGSAGSQWSSDISILETLMNVSKPEIHLKLYDGSTRRRLRALTSRMTAAATQDHAQSLNRRLRAFFAETVTSLRPRIPRYNEKLNVYELNSTESYSSYVYFHNNIRRYHLYNPRSVDDLQSQMVNGVVWSVREKAGGSQLKLTLTYKDGSKSLWKPYRFNREHEISENIFYFGDFDRFNAEIAAFHLDRILGFYRTPPTYGRDINITESFLPHAHGELIKTFFISPVGNVCFHGTCRQYCETGHAVCGRPEFIEGSVAVLLPDAKQIRRVKWPYPWRRTYSTHKKEKWRTDPNFCDKVKGETEYSKGRRLLDLIDMAIFDFLIGNMDRHHYETFYIYGNDTFILHLNNGKGFGKAEVDDISILAPLTQCCEIRNSTLRRLAEFLATPLSEKMRESLNRDTLKTILTDAHLNALDRRVVKVIEATLDCRRTKKKVIVDDGF